MSMFLSVPHVSLSKVLFIYLFIHSFLFLESSSVEPVHFLKTVWGDRSGTLQGEI